MVEEFRGQCLAVSHRISPLGPPGAKRGLQFSAQRLGFNEVASVEAFGEPAVDRCEEVARFGALALIAPQAREAGRCAQRERVGTLLAGDGEGAVIAGGAASSAGPPVARSKSPSRRWRSESEEGCPVCAATAM